MAAVLRALTHADVRGGLAHLRADALALRRAQEAQQARGCELGARVAPSTQALRERASALASRPRLAGRSARSAGSDERRGRRAVRVHHRHRGQGHGPALPRGLRGSEHRGRGRARWPWRAATAAGGGALPREAPGDLGRVAAAQASRALLAFGARPGGASGSSESADDDHTLLHASVALQTGPTSQAEEEGHRAGCRASWAGGASGPGRPAADPLRPRLPEPRDRRDDPPRPQRGLTGETGN